MRYWISVVDFGISATGQKQKHSIRAHANLLVAAGLRPRSTTSLVFLLKSATTEPAAPSATTIVVSVDKPRCQRLGQ